MMRPDSKRLQRLAAILGINRRNLEYVYGKNARRLFELVDDKTMTKRVLAGADLPIVESIVELVDRRAIKTTLERLREHEQFVVKPARGFGGGGVLVQTGAMDESRRAEIEFHIAAILSGMYALDALTDAAIVEEYIVEDPDIVALHAGTGVADLRVIMCDGQAAMAMLRLPCRESSPTANLHRGGIGVGVDLETGVTTAAIRKDRPIEVHPDSGRTLSGLQLPHWKRIREITAPLNEVFGLGYVGADIALHATRGPIFLEVNARPGLAIQLANREGLRPSLERIVQRAE